MSRLGTGLTEHVIAQLWPAQQQNGLKQNIGFRSRYVFTKVEYSQAPPNENEMEQMEVNDRLQVFRSKETSKENSVVL